MVEKMNVIFLLSIVVKILFCYGLSVKIVEGNVMGIEIYVKYLLLVCKFVVYVEKELFLNIDFYIVREYLFFI